VECSRGFFKAAQHRQSTPYAPIPAPSMSTLRYLAIIDPLHRIALEALMKSQRFLIVLTVFNILLLVFSVGQTRAVATRGDVPILRGRALEIVDERGRVRASIRIQPADPTMRMQDGTIGYPETVLLRLIDSRGGPNVKLGATERGAGLFLGGESDPTYVQILAKGPSTSLKLSNQDGREHLIQP
jgi:hypothetical protein